MGSTVFGILKTLISNPEGDISVFSIPKTVDPLASVSNLHVLLPCVHEHGIKAIGCVVVVSTNFTRSRDLQVGT